MGLKGRLRRAAGRVSQSRALARWLFGVEFPRAEAGARYFDLTTPVLVSVVAPRLRPGTRLLDMGTGAFATIGLALWRRTGCDVVSTDVRGELVRQARANVEANRAGACVRVVWAAGVNAPAIRAARSGSSERQKRSHRGANQR